MKINKNQKEIRKKDKEYRTNIKQKYPSILYQKEGGAAVKALIRILSVAFVSILSFSMVSRLVVQAEGNQRVEAEIPVSCRMLKDHQDHVYQIMIEPERADYPRPNEELLLLTEQEKGKFEIGISEPGSYFYKVFEQKGEDARIQYDERIYSVEVFVVESCNGLLLYSLSASVDGNYHKPEELEFCNTVLSDKETKSSEPSPDDEISHPSVSSGTGEDSVSQPEISRQPDTSSGSILESVINLVKTGDRNCLMLLWTITGCSAGMILLLLLRKKRKREEKEEQYEDT